jgi:uncharacterized protein (DUF924 family)
VTEKSRRELRPAALLAVGIEVSDDNHPNTTADELLQYWFGTLDDTTTLDREAEPFSTHFARWYGKRPKIDAEIRARFEGSLIHVSSDRSSWDETVRRWSDHPRGLLALTILLDQLPRNMYRGTARMYAFDTLGLLVSERARTEMEIDTLPLTQQMFLAVPLMHVEDLVSQQRMLSYFKGLLTQARQKSPNNVGFYQFALQYAQRHVDVVATYGRFPHRNELLGRPSTAEEQEFLRNSDAYF